MIELERTFLAKKIPDELKNCKFKEIIDIYIPKNIQPPKHAPIRLRKNGDKYEITKKEVVNNDYSQLREQTIILSEGEFKEFLKIDGKKIRKIRYYYNYKGKTAEIDVFQDKLKGLILIDFEFENEEDKANFEIPEFCMVEVTNEDFIAGGILCGKSYEDIKKELEEFNYKPLFL